MTSFRTSTPSLSRNSRIRLLTLAGLMPRFLAACCWVRPSSSGRDAWKLPPRFARKPGFAPVDAVRSSKWVGDLLDHLQWRISWFDGAVSVLAWG